MVLTNEELREKYRAFARWYDIAAGLRLLSLKRKYAGIIYMVEAEPV